MHRRATVGPDGLAFLRTTAAAAALLALSAASLALPVGAAILNGTQKADDIKGTGAADTIDGRNGDDTIAVGAGDDTVHGGAGNDAIDGNEGDDTLFGDGGNDTFRGGFGDDTIVGGPGEDTVDYGGISAPDANGQGIAASLADGGTITTSTVGTDTVSGIENLTGSRFADNISGSDGANVIRGGAGDDLIFPGGGNDVLNGGPGRDLFDFFGFNGEQPAEKAPGNDIVEDFTRGQDKLYVYTENADGTELENFSGLGTNRDGVVDGRDRYVNVGAVPYRGRRVAALTIDLGGYPGLSYKIRLLKVTRLTAADFAPNGGP